MATRDMDPNAVDTYKENLKKQIQWERKLDLEFEKVQGMRCLTMSACRFKITFLVCSGSKLSLQKTD